MAFFQQNERAYVDPNEGDKHSKSYIKKKYDDVDEI